jgi:phosphohistidine swiveling domain-containing protein
MAHMDIGDFISRKTYQKEYVFPFDNIARNKSEKELLSCILLPSILSSNNDFFYFNSLESKPNFITSKLLEASVVLIEDSFSGDVPELKDKIVVVEAADPGYDWIFLKGIAGLVTKYGGVGSHMAIRCHELNIPAAIGCGDMLFEEITKSKRIVINAPEERISLIE